ncbi:MAG: ABC transporter transmembrane domain-containing protein [Pseudomonadota bacterium]
MKDALVRMFGFAWPYRASGALLILSTLAVTFSGLAAPWLISKIVEVLEAGGADTVRQLGLISGLLVLVVVLRGIGQGTANHFAHVVAFNACRDLRDAVYAHVQSFSPSWFSERKSGDITKRVVDDSLKLEPILADAFLEFFTAALLSIGILIILLLISPLLTLVVLAPLVAAIFIIKHFGTRAMRSFDSEAHREGQLVALVQDHVSGIKETQIFNRETYLRSLFQKRSSLLAKRQIRSRTLMSGFFPTIEGAAGLSTALVVLVGGILAFDGTLTTAQVVAFILYIVYLYEPLYSALMPQNRFKPACQP